MKQIVSNLLQFAAICGLVYALPAIVASVCILEISFYKDIVTSVPYAAFMGIVSIIVGGVWLCDKVDKD